jgi:ribonuclease HI
METIYLYFDGASKGNGGESGCGCVVKFDEGEDGIIKQGCGYKYLGTKTNNEAEYSALLLGFNLVLSLEYTDMVKPENIHINVYGDSKLVIEQMKGKWQVKAENLKPLWEEATKLSKQFKSVTFKHIDRSLNTEADRLANQAVTTKQSSF